MYTITKEQIALGVKAGLELLNDPKSDMPVPVRLLDGLSILKVMLGGIARGEIAISAVESAELEEVPLDTPDEIVEGD